MNRCELYNPFLKLCNAPLNNQPYLYTVTKTDFTVENTYREIP